MLEAIVVLATIILAQAFLAERQRSKLEETAIEERIRHEQALQILCERIQHPERVQVAPQPYESVELPRDASEHAWVGEMVPDFVDVGTPNGDENA